MRLRDWLSVTLRDIGRQPVRSSLTLTALVISTSLLVTLVTLGLQTRSAILEQLGQDPSVTAILVTSAGAVQNEDGTSEAPPGQAAGGLTDATLTSLARVPGVRSVTPVVSVWQFRQFSVAGYERSLVARTQAIDPATATPFTLAAGRQLSSTGSAPQVVLGNGYARALGVADDPQRLVGRSVQITTPKGYRGEGARRPVPGSSAAEQRAVLNAATVLTATVAGVAAPDQNDTQMFISMRWAHALSTVEVPTADGPRTQDGIDANGYSGIVVQAAGSALVRPVAARIDAMGYGTASSQAQIDQVNQLSVVMWIVLGAIALISLISAALGIVNTMLMTVSEQRYAIGVWRVCGATRSLITRLFLVQAALLGLVGGAVGTAIGLSVSWYVNNKIAVLLRDQGLSAMTIDPPSTTFVVSAIGLTTLLAVLAGLYPARRAAQQIQV